MNKKMMFVVLALIVMAQVVTGCCNRCNKKSEMAYGSVPVTSAAQTQAYSSQPAAGNYSANRQAIK